MTKPLPDRLWTTREVASYLGKSLPSVYRLIRAGKLRATKVGGEWRVASDAVRQLLEEGIHV